MAYLVPLVIVLVGGITLLAIIVVRGQLQPRQIPAILKLLKAGKYQLATKAAKALVAREPRNADAHYCLGLIYQTEGKGELALMEYKAVNALSQFGPYLPETEFRKRVAELYGRFGQNEEALKEYLLLMKLEPGNAEHYYRAAKLFDERSRSDNAIGYLRKALELDPRHAKAHFELGIILYRDKKPLEAKNELNASLKYDSDNSAAFFYLGKLLKESHDNTGALVAFEKAMRDPEYKLRCLVERGGCYMANNDFERAVPELERAVRSIKDESSNEALYGRYFLAMCYEKQRDLDRAIEQWERIYSRKPAFRDVAEKLSQYQEFRSDDRMKDYLTCTHEEFSLICQSIITSSLGLQAREVIDKPFGIDVIAVEPDNTKWLAAKKMPKLFRFIRSPDVVEDGPIRALLEEVKKQNIMRCAIFSSAGFTRTAMEYAENRPIELFGKDQLQTLLNKADFFSRKPK